MKRVSCELPLTDSYQAYSYSYHRTYMQNECSVTGCSDFLVWEMQPMKLPVHLSENKFAWPTVAEWLLYIPPAIKQNLLGAKNLISDDGEVEPAVIQSR